MKGIQIVGMGHALPGKAVTNADMERIVDTTDEWIQSRSGIANRYVCTGEERLTDLAVKAGAEALQRAGLAPADIDMVITATCTAGFQVPSVACIVQKSLGLPSGIPAFDINCACTGFIYGLQLVHALMNQNQKQKYALLIGVEQISNFLDYTDRSTCVLFGDGAGAAVIKATEEKRFFSHLAAEGDEEALFAENMEVSSGAYAQTLSAQESKNAESIKSLSVSKDRHRVEKEMSAGGYDRQDIVEMYPFIREKARITHLHMDGRKVFRFATSKLAGEIEELQSLSGVAATEVDHIICHQANKRIIEHVRKKWKLPEEKFFMNLQKYGNTSAASIPLVLYDLQEQGRLKSGDRVFCIGFGAGLTWGGAYLEF